MSCWRCVSNNCNNNSSTPRTVELCHRAQQLVAVLREVVLGEVLVVLVAAAAPVLLVESAARRQVRAAGVTLLLVLARRPARCQVVRR